MHGERGEEVTISATRAVECCDASAFVPRALRAPRAFPPRCSSTIRLFPRACGNTRDTCPHRRRACMNGCTEISARFVSRRQASRISGIRWFVLNASLYAPPTPLSGRYDKENRRPADCPPAPTCVRLDMFSLLFSAPTAKPSSTGVACDPLLGQERLRFESRTRVERKSTARDLTQIKESPVGCPVYVNIRLNHEAPLC